MSTKYAKARDTAHQWRSEYRKVKTENKSLRRVYEAAKALSALLESTPPVLPAADAIQFAELARRLKQAQSSAVFAEGGDE